MRLFGETGPSAIYKCSSSIWKFQTNVLTCNVDLLVNGSSCAAQWAICWQRESYRTEEQQRHIRSISATTGQSEKHAEIVCVGAQ